MQKYRQNNPTASGLINKVRTSVSLADMVSNSTNYETLTPAERFVAFYAEGRYRYFTLKRLDLLDAIV